MKLLTKASKNKLISNHEKQDGTKTFPAVVKLFNPTGAGTWYLSELDPKTNIAFGICEIHSKEYGYVSLDELASFKGFAGLGIEKDLYFSSTPLEEIMGGAA